MSLSVSVNSCRGYLKNILCSATFLLWKSCRLCANVEKFGTATQSTDGSIMCGCFDSCVNVLVICTCVYCVLYCLCCVFCIVSFMYVSRGNSVGIATCCGLLFPGIESRWGRDFPHPQTSPRAHSVSYTVVTASFTGVKWPGRDVDHPPPSSAEVKERVELHLYSPSGFSWPVIGWTLSFMNVGESKSKGNF
jgi:hypothetical protein